MSAPFKRTSFWLHEIRAQIWQDLFGKPLWFQTSFGNVKHPLGILFVTVEKAETADARVCFRFNGEQFLRLSAFLTRERTEELVKFLRENDVQVHSVDVDWLT